MNVIFLVVGIRRNFLVGWVNVNPEFNKQVQHLRSLNQSRIYRRPGGTRVRGSPGGASQHSTEIVKC
jgi:hypothetical protein